MHCSIGIDIGSTTVKAVVMDTSHSILFKRYVRHNTRQLEHVYELLTAIDAEFPHHAKRIYLTGSGSRPLIGLLKGVYIQEVNAVTYAVEKLFTDVGAVVELGGQDAKVIVWKTDAAGNKSALTYMNDKCAGGTGATLDKIVAKVGIDPSLLGSISDEGAMIYHIAAKCGVFAETDVVGLLKSGASKIDVIVSLCHAIVKQNLEVLVRGNVLRDRVCLLGGPHRFLPVLASVWRHYIRKTWALHGHEPRTLPDDKLIFVPEDSHYFAAMGAIFFGEANSSKSVVLQENDTLYAGPGALADFITTDRLKHLEGSGAIRAGLVETEQEVELFVSRYGIPTFKAPQFEPGASLSGYLGIDGGSTSTKMVIIDKKGLIIYRDYMLSGGNPVADAIALFGRMQNWIRCAGITLDICGTAVTGYASALLKAAFKLDCAIVETVAHMRSAVASYGDVDVICDVGGQDIKVLFLKHGRVVDFKLNTQCSAGNGYFLQSMAEQFGVPLHEYAERAFTARKAPAFNYGCAVFMEQDRVNFQQLGWTNSEIMAGLALVLPLNIWNYVVQEPHIAKFGTTFLLQGGTQKNVAAAKAQVDYILQKVPSAKVHVHKHAEICGALGAAIEASERVTTSTFAGVAAAALATFTTSANEETRCGFCTNKCQRTFVDVTLCANTIRFITGNQCEKGQMASLDEVQEFMKVSSQQLTGVRNLVGEAAVSVFAQTKVDCLPPEGTSCAPIKWFDGSRSFYGANKKGKFRRSDEHASALRASMKIGMPRLLNMYYAAPFFDAYFRTLGIAEIIWSDYTSQALWQEGNTWGSIDPCFPAKVAPAHFYNLLMHKDVTHICFPIITHLLTDLSDSLANTACAIQMGTPEVVHASFTKELDVLLQKNIEYFKPLVVIDRPLDACGLMYDYFADRLKITPDENQWAVSQGFLALARYQDVLQQSGVQVLNHLVEHDRIGVLAIGHPYHHDPGLNHGILDEFQKRGFPVLCIESLPTSDDFLKPLFPEYDTTNSHKAMGIRSLWQRNFNRNTNQKIWAATIAARHPNLAVVDFSSFKCGHDAPTYSYIDAILDASETPHFLFHDLDQNKPRASFQIRLETIDYFLRLEEEKLCARGVAHSKVNQD